MRRAFQLVVRTEGEGYEANHSRERSVANEETAARETDVVDGLGIEDSVGTLQVPGMYHEVDAQIMWPRVETADSDVEDEGGNDGLAKAADKGKMRMKRSFELVFKSGYVMRFEVIILLREVEFAFNSSTSQAHSCKIAIDWIARLRALITYWKLRHRTSTLR